MKLMRRFSLAPEQVAAIAQEPLAHAGDNSDADEAELAEAS
jgi:hypothetical protein